MRVVPVPMGPSSDKAKSRQGGGATLVNCYVEKTEGGKTEYSLNTRPRLGLFASIPTASGGGRGALTLNNYVYAVMGEGLFKIGASGASTFIGVVLGQTPVTMSSNRAVVPQIVITTDTQNYICEGDVLSVIADPDLPAGATSNTYINGRIVIGINDGRHFWSDAENANSWSALNFAEAERDADQGVRVFAYGEDFWHFGEKSREIIRYTGNSANLFVPLLGAGQSEGDGLGAKFSVATVNGIVYWVNDYGKVVVSSGGKSADVSTHEVARDIERCLKIGLKDQITAFGLSIEGHDFYWLRSPLWCWIFDTATSIWTPQKSYLSETFACAQYVRAFNKNLAIDATLGKIYEISNEFPDDAGQPCIVKITTNPLNAFPDGYDCAAFHLGVQSGTGIAKEPQHVVDPQVTLRVSRDGGMTFGNEHRRSAGKRGVYNANLRFNKLGATGSKGMVFEIALPEPVERGVFQASAHVAHLKA